MVDEMRGEWPGGMRLNSRGYAVLGPDYKPIFDCRLCQRHVLHTQSEHKLAMKPEPEVAATP